MYESPESFRAGRIKMVQVVLIGSLYKYAKWIGR